MNWHNEPELEDPAAPGAHRAYRAISDDGLNEEEEGGLDLSRFLVAALKYKYVIAFIIAIATAGAAYYAENEPRRYQATVEVLLDPPSPGISPFKNASKRQGEFRPETEAALLTSRKLAREAAKRLNLRENPLFSGSPTEGENKAVAMIKRQLAQTFGETQGQVIGTMGNHTNANGKMPITPPKAAAPPLAVVAERYLRGLSVNIDGSSYIMRISYTSKDPEFTATAANTTAELYIERKRKDQGRAVREVNAWLRARVNEARAELLRSERKLEELRQAEGLSGPISKSLPSQQLTRLNDRLLDAKGKANEIKTRYRQIQRLLQGEVEIETVGPVLESDMIQRLRVERLNLNQNLGELRTRYREEHPKVQNTRKELKNLNEKINSEIRSISENIKFEKSVIEERISKLKKQIHNAEYKVDNLRKAEAKVRTLRSEVKANRDLYSTLLQRLQEANLQEQMKPQPQASIINQAQTPNSPFYPNEKLFISAAFLGSSMLAFGLAFGLEFLRRGVGSLTELTDTADVEPVGVLPHERPPRRSDLPTRVGQNERTPFVDSLRRLRQNLTPNNAGERPKTLLISSAWPGEGKTTVARALAALDGVMGQSAIVMECYHGEGHDLQRSPYEVGWIQYLEYGKSISEIVVPGEQGDFAFLPAGRMTERAGDLQASTEFATLLKTLRESYELVIVDAPAILDDKRILSHASFFDQTIILINANRTTKSAISYAVRSLLEAGLRPVGAALTMVDMRDYTRRESGEFRAVLDRPGRKLPYKQQGHGKMLPLIAGAMTVLTAVAMLAERLISLPPE